MGTQQTPANQAMTLLVDAMAKLDEPQAEWLTALFYAALDQSPSDPVMAVKKAISSFKASSGAAMSNAPLCIALAFDPMQHPRKKKGKGGGQFVKKGTSDSGIETVTKAEDTEQSEEEKLRAEFEQFKKERKKHRYTSEQLREAVEKREGTMKSHKVAGEVMDTAIPVGRGKYHGMTDEEEMVSVEIDGISIMWAPDAEADTTHVRVFIQKMMYDVGNSIPPGLMKGTKYVVFTKQPNKDDVYWRALYPGFTSSTASAGDGGIVVYNNDPVSSFVLTHEAGHNLANEIWGSPTPPPDSKYGKAQKKEFAVTEYGDNAPSEDFAEACRLYANPHTRPMLERDYPLKFAALQEIIEEGSDESIPLQSQKRKRKRPMGPPESSGEGGGPSMYMTREGAIQTLYELFPGMEDMVIEYVQESDAEEGDEYWEHETRQEVIQGFQNYIGIQPPMQKQVDYEKEDYPNIPKEGKTYLVSRVKELTEEAKRMAKKERRSEIEIMMELMFGIGYKRTFSPKYTKELTDFVEREMAKW